MNISFVSATSFKFSGPTNSKTYNIDNASTEFSNEYRRDVQVTSLVVASKECAQDFEQQSKVIESLDAETLGFILISACAEEVNDHGYHTNISVALQILNGANEKLLIYAPNGEKIYSGQFILETGNILQLIRNK
ncbi:MAG: hypothetical protein ACPGJI_05815 [Kangiellaceae bacterium]